MKIYLVWENDDDCGGDDCYCNPRTLVAVYKDKLAAEEFAKTLWGGRVTEEEMK